VVAASPSSPTAPERPRLSIVVLPFANLSDDREQEYFADGVTEDFTTDLSRIADSFVIARNTAFTFKGRAVDIRQVGRELGVRYALEGSVRRVGEQVRINAQLIDAETGAHVWAERLDGSRADLFRLQDEVVAQIARALRHELVSAEGARAARARPRRDRPALPRPRAPAAQPAGRRPERSAAPDRAGAAPR
jgi:TolB-like protein